MKAPFCFFLLLITPVLLAAGCATPRHAEPILGAELEAMFDSDQLHRVRLVEIGKEHGYESPEMLQAWEAQQEIDDANIARLVEIIEAYGWPGRTLAGDRGGMAAFLVLQHADLTYQKQYLPLVRAAVSAGELGPENLALLEDRILMREGRRQVYGTQLQVNDEGALAFYPIEDESNVDARRQAVGLAPLAEYAERLGFEYTQPK